MDDREQIENCDQAEERATAEPTPAVPTLVDGEQHPVDRRTVTSLETSISSRGSNPTSV